MTTPHASPHRGSRHERWLLAAAQHNDRHAIEELIRRYTPLVHAATRSHAARPAGREREDLAQAARAGLWLAIRTWQPQRGPFPAYAKTCVRNSTLNALKTSPSQRILDHALTLQHSDVQPAGQRHTLAPDSPAEAGLNERDCSSDPVAIVIMRDQVERLTERERRLLAGALLGKTGQQLAEEEGSTRKAVARMLERVRAKLAGDRAVL